SLLDLRGFAPQTPLHALSRAASPARSVSAYAEATARPRRSAFGAKAGAWLARVEGQGIGLATSGGLISGSHDGQLNAADAKAVAVLQHRARGARAVDEGAVGAVEIDDFELGGAGREPAVQARHQ